MISALALTLIGCQYTQGDNYCELNGLHASDK